MNPSATVTLRFQVIYDERQGMINDVAVNLALSQVTWNGNSVTSDEHTYDGTQQVTNRRLLYALFAYKSDGIIDCTYLKTVCYRLDRWTRAEANTEKRDGDDSNKNLVKLFGTSMTEKKTERPRFFLIFKPQSARQVQIIKEVLNRQDINFDVFVSPRKLTPEDTNKLQVNVFKPASVKLLKAIVGGIETTHGFFSPQPFSCPFTIDEDLSPPGEKPPHDTSDPSQTIQFPPIDPNDPFAESKHKLAKHALEILHATPPACTLILRCNDEFKSVGQLDPAWIAWKLLDAAEPMGYLAKCVKRETAMERTPQVFDAMIKLANILACVSFHTAENIDALRSQISRGKGHLSEIPTVYPIVAQAKVGRIKGLPIEGREPPDFLDYLRPEHRPDAVDRIGGIPHAPDTGRQADDFVHEFAVGLALLLQPYGIYVDYQQEAGLRERVSEKIKNSPTDSIQQVLKSYAQDQNIHFCVLFPQHAIPSVRNLKRLKKEFPQLILLASQQSMQGTEKHFELNRYKMVHDHFAPKSIKTPYA